MPVEIIAVDIQDHFYQMCAQQHNLSLVHPTRIYAFTKLLQTQITTVRDHNHQAALFLKHMNK